MNNYKMKYHAGAQRIEREKFEQWLPIVFRVVEEINLETGHSRVYDTSVEYLGQPVWSEEKARTIAINNMQRMER